MMTTLARRRSPEKSYFLWLPGKGLIISTFYAYMLLKCRLIMLADAQRSPFPSPPAPWMIYHARPSPSNVHQTPPDDATCKYISDEGIMIVVSM